MPSAALWYQGHIPATGFTHSDTVERGNRPLSQDTPSRDRTVGPAVRSDDTNRIRPSSPDGQRRALLLGRAEGPRNVLRVAEGGVGDREVRPADHHRRRAWRTNVGCRHRQRAGGLAVADVEGAGRRHGLLVRGLRVFRTGVDALGGPREADIHRVQAVAEPSFLERHGDRVGGHTGDVGEIEVGAGRESR